MLHGIDIFYTFFPDKKLKMSTDFVFYSGPNLPITGTQNGKNVTQALQNIELKLTPNELLSAVIYAVNNNPSLKAQLCAALNGCV